uniref:Uncharacterized protein n=1 Tax=Setaria digitata TaxID=48799 RepID=A0A915Q0S3_9BILA
MNTWKPHVTREQRQAEKLTLPPERGKFKFQFLALDIPNTVLSATVEDRCNSFREWRENKDRPMRAVGPG